MADSNCLINSAIPQFSMTVIILGELFYYYSHTLPINVAN